MEKTDTIQDSRSEYILSIHEPLETQLAQGVESLLLYEIMARDNNNNPSASSDFFRPIDLGCFLI